MDRPRLVWCASRGEVHSGAHDPWHDQVRTIVAANGGAAALADYHAALENLIEERPNAIVIKSAEGAVDDTFQMLLDSST